MAAKTLDIRRILVIDDNEGIHGDFRKTLLGGNATAQLDDAENALFGDGRASAASSPQFEMDSALQGQEGFQMVQRALAEGRPYALAFVDMRMPPGWDGLETILELFKLDPDIQVVVCTAYSDYSWQQMFEKLGMTDRVLILKKPFDPVEVNQLATALSEKWKLKRQSQLKLGELEAMVHARTHELRQQSFRDRLTGMPNRAYVMDKLAGLLENASTCDGPAFALLFVDLDRFKTINDSLGHEIGDELLVEVGARIQGSLNAWTAEGHGAGGSFAARLGGDEFVVLLDKMENPSRLTEFSHELLATLATPYVIKGYDVHTTASIGVAVSDRQYTRGPELIRDADTAMFRAKAKGFGQYMMFDRSMHEQVLLRLTLESDLRSAVERQEFAIVYQPIIALESNALVGFEALVRWHHSTRGLVMPAEFIAVAEELNLIIPIGRMVITHVCRQIRQWRDKYPSAPHFSVSVNLSRRQFADTDFLTFLGQTLAEYALPQNSLNLEVTESMVMEQNQSEGILLRQIEKLGVNVHMDDFGTGYSSLNCLHRMPLSCLKIDRSFIVTMTAKRDYAAVISAIIQLAHNLGVHVVAEGVETREQMTMLQALDCDLAQGYLFSKPMSPEETERYFTTHNKVAVPCDSLS